ncbi:hypothetical protein NPIL_444711 [Nephila pilipes]|uniref:Uncharacterized protein n=1 Tax=Nephila pilipes TaxID=299642 RepID=A0A8X6MD53_NEPPI|nr:hypothetical protein NPIL_444711 [Nephila pilipes]
MVAFLLCKDLKPGNPCVYLNRSYGKTVYFLIPHQGGRKCTRLKQMNQRTPAGNRSCKTRKTGSCPDYIKSNVIAICQKLTHY